jgi:large subunit ribosomal protein L9
MAKSVTLLLKENVDNLGIVGDVVSVRLGYARNFLLPMDLAMEPSEEAIAELAEKRRVAERELAELRKQREKMISDLESVELTLERSCNDQGHLYGSVTQQDIAAALETVGYPVKPREVRLPHTIKRVDTYEVPIRLDADLETTIKLWVVADRKLDLDEEREEMEFDDEGNLIEKPREKPAEAATAEPAAGETASEEPAEG